MTGKIISVVNRKGGVGKTTLAIALSDAFISEYQRHISFFDLDPQSTASQAMIGEDEFLERCRRDDNLVGLIKHILGGGKNVSKKYRRGMAHQILDRAGVDLRLFPNSDKFWDLEEKEIKNDGGKALSQAIGRCVEREAEGNRIVIIDCPPGQSVSALAAIKAAQLVLCPITPDRFALWGTELLDHYIRKNAEGIRPTFIVTRAKLNTLAANRFFEEISQKENIKILRVDTGTPTTGTEGAIALMSERASVQNRIHLEGPTSFNKMYGSQVASELKNIVNAIEREFSEDG